MTRTTRSRIRSVVASIGRVAATIGVIAFLAVFFVIPGPLISTAAEVGQGIAFAEVDGRDVAIVSYADHGYGGFSFFLPWQQHARVVAIDLATGESVWDRGVSDTADVPAVLAAGDEYAYLRDAIDLIVIDLTDGSVVARAADIAGLGDFEAFQAEIIHSPRENAIMLRPESGRVRAIMLDTLVAVEVDSRTDATWGCVLERGGQAYFTAVPEPVLIDRVPTDDGSLGFGLPAGAAPGTPGKLLSRGDEEGTSVAVGSQTFVAGGFVAESVMNEPQVGACPTAQWHDDVFPGGESTPAPLGEAPGFAVVEHDASARDDDRAISVVDTASGEVLGTNPADWGVTQARNAPDGGAVVVVQRFIRGPLPSLNVPITATVVIVASDGSTREVVLAKHGWFGFSW
ncbi:PA2928 family protein [Microbacterium sp. AGC85]